MVPVAMENTNTVTVRPATEADLDALGQMAGALVRFHHEVDPRRFLLAKGVEEGYRRWFRQELGNGEAMIRVAEGGDHRVLGYTYARVEPRDWNMLLDQHIALHDIFVDPASRGARVGELLMAAFVADVEARGNARVVLHTMVSNERAQRLFAKYGFRPTMLEMTRG
jgi:ribosomal protein S18 acetylase RimI-like enzyme